METIIKKAIEGGYKGQEKPQFWATTVVEPTFWQALGKACGWEYKRKMWNCTNKECSYANDEDMETILESYCSKCGHKKTAFQKDYKEWLVKAKTFHEINLTERWEKAVAYLQEITK